MYKTIIFPLLAICELKLYWSVNNDITMDMNAFLLIHSQYCCLWRSWTSQWSDCAPATQYHSELSDSLPVSAVRIYSITTKLSVWRKWNMEHRPLSSGMHDDTNNNTANISITSRYSWRILDQKVFSSTWFTLSLYGPIQKCFVFEKCCRLPTFVIYHLSANLS